MEESPRHTILTEAMSHDPVLGASDAFEATIAPAVYLL